VRDNGLTRVTTTYADATRRKGLVATPVRRALTLA
jgi:hypothetical protein